MSSSNLNGISCESATRTPSEGAGIGKMKLEPDHGVADDGFVSDSDNGGFNYAARTRSNQGSSSSSGTTGNSGSLISEGHPATTGTNGLDVDPDSGLIIYPEGYFMRNEPPSNNLTGKVYFKLDDGRIFASHVVLERIPDQDHSNNNNCIEPEQLTTESSEESELEFNSSTCTTSTEEGDYDDNDDSQSQTETDGETLEPSIFTEIYHCINGAVTMTTTTTGEKVFQTPLGPIKAAGDNLVVADTLTAPIPLNSPTTACISIQQIPTTIFGNGNIVYEDDTDEESSNPYLHMGPRCTAKAELEAYHNMKNPKPSTSKTLRREMGKIHRAAAKRELQITKGTRSVGRPPNSASSASTAKENQANNKRVTRTNNYSDDRVPPLPNISQDSPAAATTDTPNPVTAEPNPVATLIATTPRSGVVKTKRRIGLNFEVSPITNPSTLTAPKAEAVVEPVTNTKVDMKKRRTISPDLDIMEIWASPTTSKTPITKKAGKQGVVPKNKITFPAVNKKQAQNVVIQTSGTLQQTKQPDRPPPPPQSSCNEPVDVIKQKLKLVEDIQTDQPKPQLTSQTMTHQSNGDPMESSETTKLVELSVGVSSQKLKTGPQPEQGNVNWNKVQDIKQTAKKAQIKKVKTEPIEPVELSKPQTIAQHIQEHPRDTCEIADKQKMNKIKTEAATPESAPPPPSSKRPTENSRNSQVLQRQVKTNSNSMDLDYDVKVMLKQEVVKVKLEQPDYVRTTKMVDETGGQQPATSSETQQPLPQPAHKVQNMVVRIALKKAKVSPLSNRSIGLDEEAPESSSHHLNQPIEALTTPEVGVKTLQAPPPPAPRCMKKLRVSLTRLEDQRQQQRVLLSHNNNNNNVEKTKTPGGGGAAAPRSGPFCDNSGGSSSSDISPASLDDNGCRRSIREKKPSKRKLDDWVW